MCVCVSTCGERMKEKKKIFKERKVLEFSSRCCSLNQSDGVGEEVGEANGPWSDADCRGVCVNRLCVERPCRIGRKRMVCIPCACACE